MRYLRGIVLILVFVLLLSFAIKNSDRVSVHYFLGWEWHPTLSEVALFFFVAGVVAGVLPGAAWLYRHRREVLQLRRELRQRRATHDSALEVPREHHLL